MQRGGQARPLDRGARAVRREHRHVEPLLQEHLACRPDAVEKAPVGSAAAKEHVLPIVETEPVVPDRRRETAEDRAPLEEHDLGSAVRSSKRGGHSRQATPDHADASRAHGRAPARLRAATNAFSQVGNATRPSVTAIGSLLIRSRRRR